MSTQNKIIDIYQNFLLSESKESKNELRSEIKKIATENSDLDSDCYHILGLIDYESDDWENHIENSIKNFKQAIELDKNNFLAQLYLAHCYHDLNQLELAIENYNKVDKFELKEFQVWRYVKLIEQIGYCEYKLGNKDAGEEYFNEVLDWYKKLPESERVTPSELINCLPDNHRIVSEIKEIEPYLN